MKKYLFVFTLTIIAIIGCSKDAPTNPDNNNNNNNTTTYKSAVSANITGEYSDNFSGLTFFNSTGLNNLDITGMDYMFMLTVSGVFDKLGTYNLTTDYSSPKILLSLNANFTGFKSVSGEIVITQIDKSVIIGTFKCVAAMSTDTTKKLTISNGKFVAPVS